ncbi:unnamed protein product [Rotaria sp. Silwood2]|nr:unnamed protein product [Rotaria sp. Silwood2]
MASNVDKNFHKYDAAENNMCQTFVENIIEINGLTPNICDQATLNALKPQDGKALIATLGSRSNLVKATTDLGSKLDKLILDRKIRWKKSPPKDFALLPIVSGADLESIYAMYNAMLLLEQNAQGLLNVTSSPK